MKRFDDTGLWQALRASDLSSVSVTTGLDRVLDDFIAELHRYCREETNIAERTRTLDYALSELAAYSERRTYESKKYTYFRSIIKRAINAINSELLILKMDLEHPDRFIEFPSDNPPLARWNGKIAELIEYMLPLQISGKMLLPSGKVMEYADLIRFLESAYGIIILGAYDRKSEVLSRAKPTMFIEKMLAVLREAIKKLYQ